MGQLMDDNGASLVIDDAQDGQHTLTMKELQRLLATAAANSTWDVSDLVDDTGDAGRV